MLFHLEKGRDTLKDVTCRVKNKDVLLKYQFGFKQSNLNNFMSIIGMKVSIECSYNDPAKLLFSSTKLKYDIYLKYDGKTDSVAIAIPKNPRNPKADIQYNEIQMAIIQDILKDVNNKINEAKAAQKDREDEEKNMAKANKEQGESKEKYAQRQVQVQEDPNETTIVSSPPHSPVTQESSPIYNAIEAELVETNSTIASQSSPTSTVTPTPPPVVSPPVASVPETSAVSSIQPAIMPATHDNHLHPVTHAAEKAKEEARPPWFEVTISNKLTLDALLASNEDMMKYTRVKGPGPNYIVSIEKGDSLDQAQVNRRVFTVLKAFANVKPMPTFGKCSDNMVTQAVQSEVSLAARSDAIIKKPEDKSFLQRLGFGKSNSSQKLCLPFIQ